MENTVLIEATERCDICGAQAFVRVELENGDLLFCGHHGKVNKDKLESIMVSWYDQTEKISS